jgi:glucose/arabinose dehydrogenase
MACRLVPEKALAHPSIRAGIFVAAVLVFVATASAASHDVAWKFRAPNSIAYVLDSFTPAGAALGTTGQSNPTLTLHIGTRYEVTVDNYVFHPVEFIAKGAAAAQDTILLSATGGVTGSFEADPDVAWQHSAGVTTFTLTLALYNAMTTAGHNPGYRCGVHTSAMRGNFTVLGLPLADPIPATIAKGTAAIELETLASGLASPIDVVDPADGTGRLFIVDQPGKVWILQSGSVAAVPFLDVTARVHMPGVFGSRDTTDYDERGLLGFAVHPGFTNPRSPGYRKVYTYTSEQLAGPADFTTEPLPVGVSYDHQSVIAEWTVDALNPDIIDTTTRRELIRIDQPQFNHNGGKLAFGPDGYLYISLGDGGGADDTADGHGPTGNGQNINTVHGSILRIDPLDPAATVSADAVSANGRYRVPADNPFVGAAGIDEIFAYGFRNPWRFGFDRLTGRLIVGDVGQNNVEEVNIVTKGGNYGWNRKEGTFRFDPAAGTVTDDLAGLPAGLIDPVAQYDHDEGISITGGFVYRGTEIPELLGRCVFGDFSRGFAPAAGRLFAADLDSGLIHELVIGADDRALGLYIKGFGEDMEGNLYVLAGPDFGPFGTGGVVLRIVDRCRQRLPGDVNNDCRINVTDLAALAANWLQSALR